MHKPHSHSVWHRIMPLSAVALFAATPAAHAAVTTYTVTQTYNQVVYDLSNPTWDTIFTGTFQYDDTTGTITGVTGSLSQAMTGNTSFRDLSYQLSSVYDTTLGGQVISVFHQDSTDVFDGGGFATGGRLTYGNENAYVSIFVPDADPTAALTQAQTGALAYGDCTPGSLMGMTGSVCMTGWVADDNGTPVAGGTMRGTFPVSQTITAAVPEPETYAMMLAGLGLVGAISRRRKTRAA